MFQVFILLAENEDIRLTFTVGSISQICWLRIFSDISKKADCKLGERGWVVVLRLFMRDVDGIINIFHNLTQTVWGSLHSKLNRHQSGVSWDPFISENYFQFLVLLLTLYIVSPSFIWKGYLLMQDKFMTHKGLNLLSSDLGLGFQIPRSQIFTKYLWS